MLDRSVIERFSSKWAERPSGCWEWTGSRDCRAGTHLPYGRFWLEGRQRIAHRVSWEIHHGQIPEGMCVLHRCDNAPCVNPDHLFLGDSKTNTRDMVAKCRDKAFRVFGERASRSKLTDGVVREILRSTEPQRVLAQRHGVTQTAISRIKRRETWRHVDV